MVSISISIQLLMKMSNRFGVGWSGMHYFWLGKKWREVAPATATSIGGKGGEQRPVWWAMEHTRRSERLYCWLNEVHGCYKWGLLQCKSDHLVWFTETWETFTCCYTCVFNILLGADSTVYTTTTAPHYLAGRQWRAVSDGASPGFWQICVGGDSVLRLWLLRGP